MKTVITATEPNVKSLMDQRFGRCKYFCVLDDEKDEISFVKNGNENAIGGAGTQTAENIISLGVNRVISGDFGPKAKELLDKYNVQLIKITEEQKSIEEIISSMK